MNLHRYARIMSAAVIALVSAMFLNAETVFAKQQTKEWRVPVVMEQATVRGKVVVLETRHEERRIVENLRIQVWERAVEPIAGTAAADPKPKLLHETKTDDLGMFALPLLTVGNYTLTVGDLKLRLEVVPKSEKRKDQEEAKVLLILVPRDVIAGTPQNSPRTPN